MLGRISTAFTFAIVAVSLLLVDCGRAPVCTAIRVELPDSTAHELEIVMYSDWTRALKYCDIRDSVTGPSAAFDVAVDKFAIGWIRVGDTRLNLFVQAGDTLVVRLADSTAQTGLAVDTPYHYMQRYSRFAECSPRFADSLCWALGPRAYDVYARHVDSQMTLHRALLDSLLRPQDGAVYRYCLDGMVVQDMTLRQRYAYFHYEFHIDSYPPHVRAVLDSLVRSPDIYRYPYFAGLLRDHFTILSRPGCNYDPGARFERMRTALADPAYKVFASLEACWFLHTTCDTLAVDRAVASVFRDKRDSVYTTSYREAKAALREEFESIVKSYPDVVPVHAGMSAPDLAGVNLQGDSVYLSQLRGKVLCIDFWSTRCAPCVVAIQRRVPFCDLLQDTGIATVFVSLDRDEDDTRWRDKATEYGLTGPGDVHMRTTAEMAARFNSGPIPHYVVVDRSGIIRDLLPPPIDTYRAIPLLRELLREKV